MMIVMAGSATVALEDAGINRIIMNSRASKLHKPNKAKHHPYGFFPYFGGDARWADRIVDMLPQGVTFVEVFGGGGSVTVEALKRGKYRKYVLNDVDPLVYNGYKSVVYGTPMEWNRILNDINNIKTKLINGELTKDDVRNKMKELFHRCYEDGVCESLKILLLGIPMRGGGSIIIRPNRRISVEHWIGRWNTIKKLFERADAVIRNEDAFKLIREFDSPQTVFYLDPPHIDHKNKGAYAFSFSDEDAERLGKLLREIKGKFVLKINPEDWRRVYSKVLYPMRKLLKVKRVKYKVNFAKSGRGKVVREMVFVIKK